MARPVSDARSFAIVDDPLGTAAQTGGKGRTSNSPRSRCARPRPLSRRIVIYCRFVICPPERVSHVVKLD